MLPVDCWNLKKSLPILIVLLVLAQVDLAASAGWPGALLALLHLTPAPNDMCRGFCAGLGACIDVLVLLQLARIWARHAMKSGRDPQHD
jgi:hypothetical protein